MIVFSNGCFDSPATHLGLHAGHKRLLTFVISLANHNDTVLVAVNNDDSVRKLKGGSRPLKPLADRIDEVFDYLQSVPGCRDRQVLVDVRCFSGDVKAFLVESDIKPGILVKGDEYRDTPHTSLPGADICTNTIFCPMLPGVSTSMLLERENEKKSRRFHNRPR